MQVKMSISGNSRRCRTVWILMMFTLLSLAAKAAESPRPVLVKAVCDSPISSAVISNLRAEISNSQKYRLVRDASDNGEMDVVLTIEVKCTERNKFAAIATIFGR